MSDEVIVLYVTRESLPKATFHTVKFLEGGDELDALMAVCSAVNSMARNMGITFDEALKIMSKVQKSREQELKKRGWKTQIPMSDK